jgi:uncharacterized membrane protein YkoI
MKQLFAVVLALVFAVAGVALAKGRGEKQEEKAQYHSSIQVPAEQQENESAESNENGENSENGEQGESAEQNENGENGEQGEEAEGAEANEKDGDDAAQYQSLAKITKQQAVSAASAKVAGKVTDAELENEDGNLVYGVEIQNGKGTFDVKVDAGNGAVLNVAQDKD